MFFAENGVTKKTRVFLVNRKISVANNVGLFAINVGRTFCSGDESGAQIIFIRI